jgi:hypothetical protein
VANNKESFELSSDEDHKLLLVSDQNELVDLHKDEARVWEFTKSAVFNHVEIGGGKRGDGVKDRVFLKDPRIFSVLRELGYRATQEFNPSKKQIAAYNSETNTTSDRNWGLFVLEKYEYLVEPLRINCSKDDKAEMQATDASQDWDVPSWKPVEYSLRVDGQNEIVLNSRFTEIKRYREYPFLDHILYKEHKEDPDYRVRFGCEEEMEEMDSLGFTVMYLPPDENLYTLYRDNQVNILRKDLDASENSPPQD